MCIRDRFILVPLRHAIFNNSGLATGILIMSMAAIGISLGFFYEWKSAWCSGLCPVHPVEKLYGGNVFMSMPNANCSQCMNCVIPCPDSIQNVHPSISNKTKYHAIGGLLVIGGLPGFIWGWFQVPDAASINSFNNFIGVYTIPLQGLVVTLIIYLIIQKILAASYQRKLISIFAAAGVSCYYWYRLPALLGLGNFPEDGVLVNLSNSLPIWIIPMMRIISTGFFVYWLLLRKPNHKSWVIRPEFGIK